MIKKIAISVIAAALVLTSACSTKQGGNGDAASAKAGNQTEQKKDEPVTLKLFLGGYSKERFMTTFGNYIAVKYPNVTFELYGEKESLTDVVASGVKLDMLQSTNPFTSIFDNKLEDDISDLIKTYKYDLNSLDPAVLGQMQALGKGKIYGFPNGIASYGLFYNKDLFDKFGVPYLKNGMTWDEIYELAKRLTARDGQTDYLGFLADTSSLIRYNQLSQGPVDPKTEKATVNVNNFKRIFENIDRFYKIPRDSSTVYSFAKEKNVAMQAGQIGQSGFKSNNAAGVKWGVVTMPEFSDLRGIGPMPLVPYFYVAKTSQHRDWAFKVVAFIGSEGFQSESVQDGSMPALKKRMDYKAEYGIRDPEMKGQNLIESFHKTFAKLYEPTKYDDKVFSEIIAALNDVITSKKDINTALREAEEKANKAIAEIKAKDGKN
ncbi:MAG: family 1 extracellular solute-binding protein [Paenibacillus sp.]|nr:family 1 extracellular solute-binding protein [Paenibacillus sp.]